MPTLHPARLGLALAVALLAAGAPLTGAAAKPRPPQVLTPPPPPTPPTPGVGLAAQFVRDAAAYEDYVHAAGVTPPDFTSVADVDGTLHTAAAYEPGQLRHGAVAYAAIEALDDAAFVDEVRRATPTPQARYALVARIYANPANALDFPDGPAAAGLAKAALADGGMHLFAVGNAAIAESYSMQHQAWTQVFAPDRDGRVAMVRTTSSQQRTPSSDELGALEREMVSGPATPPPATDAGPYSPLVVRAVALAALAAAGQASDEQAANLGWLTDDYFMDHCLSQSKLATYECLAVARPSYENVFCLGQYALKDTGTCVVRAAGSAVPLEIAVFPPPHIPPAHIAPRHATTTATTHRRR
jgi:hypothetical protein